MHCTHFAGTRNKSLPNPAAHSNSILSAIEIATASPYGIVGCVVGAGEGSYVGTAVGNCDGFAVGAPEVGCCVGVWLGAGEEHEA